MGSRLAVECAQSRLSCFTRTTRTTRWWLLAAVCSVRRRLSSINAAANVCRCSVWMTRLSMTSSRSIRSLWRTGIREKGLRSPSARSTVTRPQRVDAHRATRREDGTDGPVSRLMLTTEAGRQDTMRPRSPVPELARVLIHRLFEESFSHSFSVRLADRPRHNVSQRPFSILVSGKPSCP